MTEKSIDDYIDQTEKGLALFSRPYSLSASECQKKKLAASKEAVDSLPSYLKFVGENHINFVICSYTPDYSYANRKFFFSDVDLKDKASPSATFPLHELGHLQVSLPKQRRWLNLGLGETFFQRKVLKPKVTEAENLYQEQYAKTLEMYYAYWLGGSSLLLGCLSREIVLPMPKLLCTTESLVDQGYIRSNGTPTFKRRRSNEKICCE